MKPQPDLFNHPAAQADGDAGTNTSSDHNRITGKALRLAEPGAASAGLSPAQKRFNSLLARIDKLKAQIADMQTLTDAHRVVHQATLAPLRERFRLSMRAMALWLDERLQGKGLAPAQSRAAHDIFYGLCESLAAGGDDEMRALHDKRSPQTMQEKRQAAAAAMQAQMERILGKPLDVDIAPDSQDPLAALLQQAMEQLGQQADAQQPEQAAAKPDAAERRATEKALQLQDDADTVLRKVYRQLASALHPDRERDPAAQKRKTALMSEANAAYGRQDLMALLHIQLRIEQASPQSLSQIPAGQMASMTLLLRQQADELKAELRAREDALMHEFSLPPYDRLGASSLRQQLWAEEHMLMQDLAQMEEDLRLVKYDQGFKDWLKMQKTLMKRPAAGDYF